MVILNLLEKIFWGKSNSAHTFDTWRDVQVIISPKNLKYHHISTT